MPFLFNFQIDQNEAFEVYIFINIDALSTRIRGIYFIYFIRRASAYNALLFITRY